MKTYSTLKLTLAAASLVWVAAIPIAFAQAPPQLVTNGPQVSPGDSGARSAAGNIADSQRYEQTLQSNSAFRQQRMRKECGSIDDQRLHEQCVASFR
jgi:hypothetical protein